MLKYVVEFLGTMFFFFVILVTGKPIPIGLALAAAIFVGGKISGGHFNPGVSVMMAVGGKLPLKDLAPYIIAQILGGLLALQIQNKLKLKL
jgi:aquaporin Z